MTSSGSSSAPRWPRQSRCRSSSWWDDDVAFCSTPACPEALAEPGFYSSPGQAKVHVMPDAGHDLNLHRNAPAWYAIASDWLERTI